MLSKFLHKLRKRPIHRAYQNQTLQTVVSLSMKYEHYSTYIFSCLQIYFSSTFTLSNSYSPELPLSWNRVQAV